MSSTSTPWPEDADSSVDTMTRVAARLHDRFLNEYLDDDLDAILGAAAGPTGIAGSRRRRTPRRRLWGQLAGIVRRRADEAPSDEAPVLLQHADHLSRMLGNLVTHAHQRAARAPSLELDAAIKEADLLRGREVTEDTVDQANLRRLAMAILALLDQLAVDDDEPLPTFGSADRAQSRWSA
ncbi:hypothetical protein ABZU86_13010 [Streptomyces sp. NPDC005271]|uniref:hypothetical protein n=1 Tax=unclassified Streptomyces TaxID=2593676 RepID=UPI00339EF13D